MIYHGLTCLVFTRILMPLSGCAVSPESRLETSAWLSTSAHHFATLPRTNGGGLVINTSEEIEPKGLHLIRKLSGLPTFAVGPLTGGRAPSSEDTARDEDSCIKFLDSKPAASVLYVSFGSQNTIPASQMMELERGLEASGRPFIWAVRPPVEFDGTEEFRAEWLPDGFEDRVAAAAQGVVVRRWAPQVAILAHASTGAFLSHCGWNSVLESLWHGVPVVGWPLLADQVFDSRMLEELGVGMEVASGRMFGGLGKGVGAPNAGDTETNTVQSSD
ncbi:UDP-glycosyltransferase 92A1-like [Panicum virgatum]|uniref:UDP-glycosyltransferase 92A1-like n=1 Tax=Panicum virgatum TaxID=38727 RepID=UPI0019D5328F|nr:UDP-glycosyltransferase 92A1-like [Panicum virgatum]